MKEKYYEYQIDPDYANDSLTDIRNKLSELELKIGREGKTYE